MENNNDNKNSLTPEPWYKQLRGLGKEIWQGIDPVEYVKSLRSEWDTE